MLTHVMSILYAANAATAALKSFPSRTYTSLTSLSDFFSVLHCVKVSRSCLMDTSNRVTADSIAGCSGLRMYSSRNVGHDLRLHDDSPSHFAILYAMNLLRMSIGCLFVMDV